MAQYIDKDSLIAEIEKIRAKWFGINNDFSDGQKVALTKVLSLIDTLEVKEVNLEEKAIQLSHKYFPDEENIWARPNIEAQRCKSACLEMVEWFKAQKGE